MKTKQTEALKALALKVKSNFEKLSSLDCINRVHKITGRSVVESINGYKLLREKNFIEDEFLREGAEYEKKILKVIEQPNIVELISRLDLSFEAIKIGPEVSGPPIMTSSGSRDFSESRREILQAIAISDEHVGQATLDMDTAQAEVFNPLAIVARLGLSADF